MKSLALVLTGCVLFLLGALAPMIGMLSSPWAPWWFSSAAKSGGTLTQTDGSIAVITLPPGGLDLGHNIVSDVDRYQLALYASFSPAEAITATAISIAENGHGDPAALSPVNKNGTRDLGLWQINSQWWALFGGPEKLIDPIVNAQAAHYIYGRQGWCAWSTYGPCSTHPCGPPCYRDFLQRATLASNTPPPPLQG
jgi:hypothetical protein